jgi:hypothetical protein
MTTILTFNTWVSENIEHPRPLKQLSDLGINRKFGRNPHTGDKYETELFPMFRRLKPRIEALPKKPTLEEWFAMMQNSDNQFYSMVQADTLAQPDIRELWRDLTGQRASKMKRYNLSEGSEPSAWKSKLDPAWTIIALWPEDSLYADFAKIFNYLGIAFADLDSKTIYMDGVIIEKENLTNDHLLAIEAHEIAHFELEHSAPKYDQASQYNERQEMEADWFGIRLLNLKNEVNAADLLEDRYELYYGEPSSTLEKTDDLETALNNYVN